MKNARQKILFALIIFATGIKSSYCQTDPGADKYFRSALQKVRTQFIVPALGGVLVMDGKVVVAGAFGVRKQGTYNYVTDNDKFPIGSISKTFTGFVAARLTEPNKYLLSPLTWTTRIKDVFPQLSKAPGIQPGYLSKTVVQLITHQANLPDTSDETTICNKSNFNAYMICGRNEHMINNLKWAPAPWNTYSNIGPVIVANMCQKRTGKIWEDLVRQYIYNPLNISASFISSINPEIINCPQFHVENGLANKPVKYSDFDKYNIAAPAGHVTISPKDMGKYLVELMPGVRARAGALKSATLNQYLEQYNLNRNVTRGGWFVEARAGAINNNWAPLQKILTHNGSHGKNYAHAYLLPDTKLGFCSMVNTACDKACVSNRGVNAVNKLNNHFRLMWYNKNVLPFFAHNSPFSITSVKTNLTDDKLLKMKDMDMLSTWKATLPGSSFRININSSLTTIKALILIYPRNVHNIKTVRIYARELINNGEVLVHYENQIGKDNLIFQFEPALRTNKLRIEFGNNSNKTTEIAEVLLIYDDPLNRMSNFLKTIRAIDKRVIQPPPVFLPNINILAKTQSQNKNIKSENTGRGDSKSISPEVFNTASIRQNIPNPFNHSTTLSYYIPSEFKAAKIIITDKSGKIVKNVNISVGGKGSLTVDRSFLTSGAYNYSLYVDGRLIDTRQMILAK